MKVLYFVVACLFILPEVAAQNRDTALVSLRDFRLDPGTFSWRGTGTFYDMTSWNSSPYLEGNLKQKSGSNWLFRLNYRLLPPAGYDANYRPGYPLLILFHGGGERGNCWDTRCYCSGCNANGTPEPGASPEFLNNDHVLLHGGSQHLNAVTLAGARRPNDNTLPARAFPGFVLFPQNENGWGSADAGNSAVSYALRLVRLLQKQYNIDPDRIYIHGLSLGGQAVYKAMNMCDWMFAAAITMSGLAYDESLEYDSVAHIPLWAVQGGRDTNPRPAQTERMVKRYREAGGQVRHTLYPDLPHNTWNRTFQEPDFYTWLLSKRASDIHVYYDNPYICTTKPEGALLGVADGYAAYQWEYNGNLIAGAQTHRHRALQAGTYRVRFSRTATQPSERDWNAWSKPVVIEEKTPPPATIKPYTTTFMRDLNGDTQITLHAPEGYQHYQWYRNGEPQALADSTTVVIAPGDCGTPCSNNGLYTLTTTGYDLCPSLPSASVPLFFEDQAPIDNTMRPQRFRHQLMSPSRVFLSWDDPSALEHHYEVWRKDISANQAVWQLLAVTPINTAFLVDSTLLAGHRYFYKIRAINALSRSDYSPGNDVTQEADNLVVTALPDQLPPDPPQQFQAELTGLNTATLSWLPATDDGGISQYIITVNQNNITVPAQATQYVINNLQPEQIYTFTIQAVDLSGKKSSPGSQVTLVNTATGLYYRYVTGSWIDLDDASLSSALKTPEKTGHVSNITLSPRTQDDYFAFEFEGYLYIRQAGTYTFYLNSDDGSRLYLDGTRRIDFNGTHGMCTAASPDCPAGYGRSSGELYLPAGAHSIRIQMFDYTGGQQLWVRYQGPDTQQAVVTLPDHALTSGSDVVVQSPPPPSTLACHARSMTQIDVAWDYADPNANFEIYNSTEANGIYTMVARVSSKSYAHVGLRAGQAYFYKIKTVTASGTSRYSSIGSATTLRDLEVPTTPGAVSVASILHDGVVLVWDAATDNVGVVQYQVWSHGKLLGTTSIPGIRITGLSPDTYAFTVVAVDASGNKSTPSAAVSADIVLDVEDSIADRLAIFPNPARSNFTVQWRGAGGTAAQLQLVNTLQQLCFSQTVEVARLAEGIEVTVPAGWAPGLYILSLTHQGKTIRSKVVIRR